MNVKFTSEQMFKPESETGVIAALMLGALAVFRFTVKEKEWSAEMQQQTKALGIEEQPS